MREIIRILMLENDPLDTKLLIHHLLNRGLNFNFCRVNNSDDFIKELQEFNPQIILSDQSLTDFDCLSALKIALNKNFGFVETLIFLYLKLRFFVDFFVKKIF